MSVAFHPSSARRRFETMPQCQPVSLHSPDGSISSIQLCADNTTDGPFHLLGCILCGHAVARRQNISRSLHQEEKDQVSFHPILVYRCDPYRTCHDLGLMSVERMDGSVSISRNKIFSGGSLAQSLAILQARYAADIVSLIMQLETCGWRLGCCVHFNQLANHVSWSTG